MTERGRSQGVFELDMSGDTQHGHASVDHATRQPASSSREQLTKIGKRREFRHSAYPDAVGRLRAVGRIIRRVFNKIRRRIEPATKREQDHL